MFSVSATPVLKRLSVFILLSLPILLSGCGGGGSSIGGNSVVSEYVYNMEF